MGSGTSKDNAVDTFNISDDEETKSKNKDNANNKKKEISGLGKIFDKPKAKATTNLAKSRTIVDLSSSDSEDEYFHPKKDNDAELREDITSLEKTLSSLGLDKKGRQVRVEESRPPAYSSDSDGYVTSSSVTRGSKARSHRRRKDLKFSWDDRQAGTHAEDWTVNKVRKITQAR